MLDRIKNWIDKLEKNMLIEKQVRNELICRDSKFRKLEILGFMISSTSVGLGSAVVYYKYVHGVLDNALVGVTLLLMLIALLIFDKNDTKVDKIIQERGYK